MSWLHERLACVRNDPAAFEVVATDSYRLRLARLPLEAGHMTLSVNVVVLAGTIAADPVERGKELMRDLHQGDEVSVYGRLIRRFYRSGAGARILTEVVANGLKHLERSEQAHPDEHRDTDA